MWWMPSSFIVRPSEGKVVARTTIAPMRRSFHSLEHDHRDVAVGPLLVVVVRGPDLGHSAPEGRLLLRSGRARAGAEAVAFDLDFHLGVVTEVAVPRRRRVAAALGGDDEIVAVVGAVDQGRRARLPGAPALRREDERVDAGAPLVPPPAGRLPVALDVLLAEQCHLGPPRSRVGRLSSSRATQRRAWPTPAA